MSAFFKKSFEYFIFNFVKVSGLFFVLQLVLTALATGQAEISYVFWGVGQLFILISICLGRYGR